MATGKIWLIRGGICLAVAVLVATLSPKVRERSATEQSAPVFQLPDARSTRHGKVAGVLLLAVFFLRDFRGSSDRTAQLEEPS